MTLSLARRAERLPDRTAVVDISEERLYAPAETVHEDRVTYAELSAIAARTAADLSARGIGPGDTVCLVTRNRVASLALLFACRRLGATLAPISHRLTPATVERPFEALEPALVVAEAAQRDLVRSIPFDRSVTLEELAETDSGTEPADDRAADAPLVALHGEPGRPVAAFSARTLEWNCIAAVVTWGLSRDEGGIVLEPLSSAGGLIRGALPLLYVGGTLLLDRAFDPGDALTAIADHEVTALAGRTTTVGDLAAAADGDAFASLERAILDGAVDAKTIDAFLEAGTTVDVVYGRLECPTATNRTIAGAVDTDGPPPIGRPVLDCRARLVEDDAVLEGAAEGRLQLSGPVVADGYVNAAGIADGRGSREKKRADGESTSEGERGSADADDGTDRRGRFTDGWFDTGDRFRRDEDGVYYRTG